MSQTSMTASSPHVILRRTEVDRSEEAFREFVDRSSGRAMRVAWRWVGEDKNAAEDLVQDAFVAAWKALPKFRGEASLETWFFRILIRRAQNHKRWKNIRSLWSGPAESDPADPKPGPQTDPLLQSRINKALKCLSRRQREAFLLVHMDGFTVRETASILGLQPGSIKSHLHRALRHLRAELHDLAENPPTSVREEPDEAK
ncbi:MAG: RNA polymerase sigma factor [Myxococcota bacterium]|nr:RNA polymerase sigma factor [Myxococcota bacterium]